MTMRLLERPVGLPAAASVLLAAAAFGVNDALGPRPVAWLFPYGTVLLYLPWLAALAFISSFATYWASQRGASRAARAIVAVSPALAMGSVVTVLALVVATAATLGGHQVHPRDAVGHFLVGWILLPSAVGLVGAAPFLRDHK
jgi:hypothetical protein